MSHKDPGRLEGGEAPSSCPSPVNVGGRGGCVAKWNLHSWEFKRGGSCTEKQVQLAMRQRHEGGLRGNTAMKSGRGTESLTGALRGSRSESGSPAGAKRKCGGKREKAQRGPKKIPKPGGCRNPPAQGESPRWKGTAKRKKKNSGEGRCNLKKTGKVSLRRQGTERNFAQGTPCSAEKGGG